MTQDPSSEIVRSKKEIRKRNLQIGGGIMLGLVIVGAYFAFRTPDTNEYYIVEVPESE